MKYSIMDAKTEVSIYEANSETEARELFYKEHPGEEIIGVIEIER